MASSADKLSFFALTASGLEGISAQEIATLPHIRIDVVSYRRIAGTCFADPASLCTLRTVDDVFFDVATWSELGRPRSSLDRLRSLGASLDLYPTALRCARLRRVPMPPRFSLTVSFVGKRNYTGEEIKRVLADTIARRYCGWMYEQEDRLADLNIRVFLEHETAYVGVRISKVALHDRWYQRVHLPGALKPSVAAALVLLAGTTPTSTVLDPCCGSGTILIEAALQGASICGGDKNPLAIAAARTNLATAGVSAVIQQWDATLLPLANVRINCIITNLPWGRQVRIQEELSSFYQRIFTGMRQILAPGGSIVILTNAPEEIDPLDLSYEERIDISLFGQRPTILVFKN
ncbi:MAG TPA: methyltransferase [Ktedonobacteraceae bacterium]|nr:methyltransferase [Ktedonobacteraceae bacterium]